MKVSIKWKVKGDAYNQFYQSGNLTVAEAMKRYREEIEPVCVEAMLIHFDGWQDRLHKVLKVAPRFDFKVDVMVTKTISARDEAEAGKLMLGLVKDSVHDLKPDSVVMMKVWNDRVIDLDDEEDAKAACDAQDPNFN
jgi:hypothetical protein